MESVYLLFFLLEILNMTYRTLQLRACWTVFTSPLAHTIQIHDDNAGPLRGCALCIAQDGTIAVIAIDGFQL